MALLAFGLGIFSIRAAGHTFISRYEPRRHWLLLLGVAIVVSLLRGLADSIAGVLTPWRVGSFAAVCVLYAALWAVDRPADGRCQIPVQAPNPKHPDPDFQSISNRCSNGFCWIAWKFGAWECAWELELGIWDLI